MDKRNDTPRRPALILEINSEVRGTEDEFSFGPDGDLMITHKDVEGSETMALCAFLLPKEDVEHLRDWLNRHASAVSEIEGPSDECRKCGCWSRTTGCCKATPA